tara:strand:+ start:47 stop:745 length:699 start_codon:yes stop_codon:yes gene_type:complete
MIFITMAGESSRFFNAGYKTPKYRLELGSNTLFHHCLLGLKDYFLTEIFIFCVNTFLDKDISNYINDFCKINILKRFKIIDFDRTTRGQAETVYLSSLRISVKPDEPVIIWNIDTIRLHSFPEKLLGENFMELFTGNGNHWSFAKVKDGRIILVAEKKRISEYCSTGLYGFKDLETFRKAFLKTYKNQSIERYVAPIYNNINQKNIIPLNRNVSDFIFCGTPDEYEYARKLF